MRYAITYTTDETWNTVDTAIIETDTNPMDMKEEQLQKLFYKIFYDEEEANAMALDYDHWFVRNLDDTDVLMEGE